MWPFVLFEKADSKSSNQLKDIDSTAPKTLDTLRLRFVKLKITILKKFRFDYVK